MNSNIIERGLQDCVILPGSDTSDSILTTHIADINWDGVPELMLGTFGREVLCYTCTLQPDGYTVDYQLYWRSRLANPVLALDYVDWTGDGLKEVIALGMHGVHVLQVRSKRWYQVTVGAVLTHLFSG